MATTKTLREERQARHSENMSLYVEKASNDYATLRYDYAQVDAAHRTRVQDAAVDIQQREKRAAEDLVVIGQRLIEVKALLPDGKFEEWMLKEFAYSRTMATELMNVARRFGERGTLSVPLGGTVMRRLAAPSVPDEAIEDVIEFVEREGRPPKVTEAEHIIRLHRAPMKTISIKATPVAPPPEPPPAPLPDTDMPPDLRRAGYWLQQYPGGEWGWRTSTSGDAPYDSRDEAIMGARKDLASKSNDAMPTIHGLAVEPAPPSGNFIATEPAIKLPESSPDPIIAETEPEPEPIHPFEAWIAAMPPVTGLYECRLLVELGQFGAQRARRLDGDMRRFVDDLEMPTRLLIGKLNRKAKGQP